MLRSAAFPSRLGSTSRAGAPSNLQESSDEDLQPYPLVKKKQKRVLRACDQCRKRKIRCDSATMPHGRCSNCLSFDLDCTQVEPAKKRGPKGQSQALQQRVHELEALLRKLRPDIDLEEELLDSIDVTAAPPSRSSSERTVPSAQLPGPTLLVSGSTDVSDSSETETTMAKTLAGLQIDYDQDRFFGQSSGFMFMRQALNIKKELTKESPINFSPTGVWQVHPWELELEQHETFPKYTFPEEDLMEHLIGLYFQNTHVHIPFIHRPTFMKNFESGLHHRNPFFASVVIMIFAIASRYSNDPRVLLDGHSLHSSGWKWFQQVSIIRKSLLKTACLFELQFYALAAMYVQGTSSPQMVWTMAGLGLRFAQERGVHRKKPAGHVWTVDDEQWKRCFWVLLHFDRIICSFLGRPCSVHVEDFDLELPFECDDEYWENDDPSKAFVQPPGRPSYVAYFNWSIKLGDILAHALRTIYCVNKYRHSLKQSNDHWETDTVAILDNALNKWVDDLPDHLRWDPEKRDSLHFKQSSTIYAHYYYVVIQVHRPFIPSMIKNFSMSSLVTCANAARSLSRVIAVMNKRSPLFHPHIQMAAYTAAIVILINLYGAKTDSAKPSLALDPHSELAHVKHCLEYLDFCKQRWHIAGRFQEMIQQLASISDARVLSSPEPRHKRDRPDDELSDPEGAPATGEREHPETRQYATNRRLGPLLTPLRSHNLPVYSEELRRMPSNGSFASRGYQEPEVLPSITSHTRHGSASAPIHSSGSLPATSALPYPPPYSMDNPPSGLPPSGHHPYPTTESSSSELLPPGEIQGSQYHGNNTGYENTMHLWSNAPINFGLQDWSSYLSNGVWNREGSQPHYTHWS